MRVLIVDDSPLVWSRLFEMLRELSFVSLLLYARSLAEARHCLEGCAVDLVVLDIALPDGNGLELLREIQASPSAPRVALFTNNAELHARGLALGAHWFFDKSLDFSGLMTLLKDRAYWVGLVQERRGHADARV